MKKNPLRSLLIAAASCAVLLMVQMNSPAQTLLNRWSFNAPAGSLTVTDSVAGVIATLNGDASLDGTEVNLDGATGTYVTLSSNLLAGVQAVSCEGWADSAASPDNVCLFSFDDGVGTGATYARYVIHDGGNTDNQFELADFGGTTGDPNQQLKSPAGWGGVPVHVVCVYDPTVGIQAIYTNGILEAYRNFPVNQTTLSSVSSNSAALGRSPWWAYGDPYLAGTISEFRIWNGQLNGLQVAALDAAGAGTINTNYGTVTNLQLEVTYQMTQHAVQQAVVLASASALTVSPDIASLCSYASGNTNILTVSGTGSITAVGAGSTTIKAVFGTVSTSQTITVAQSVAVLSNRWSFFIPPVGSLTVTDSVHAVVATLNGDATLDGTEVNLDGTTGTYVELGANLLNGIQSLTCEAWVPTNAVSPDNVHVFEFGDGNGTGNAYYRYNLHNSGNANNFAELADVQNGGNEKLGSPVGWGGFGLLHVVTIYDPVAQVQAIFTNGALETLQTGVTTALSGVSSNEAALGQSPWFAYGDPYLNGSISEFRIYSGELTPQQIAMDYLTGPTNLNTTGPGALQSIALKLGATMNLGVSATPPLLATYANLPNFNLTANSIFPVAGLTITSSATNIINVNDNILTAVSSGTAIITASYQGFSSSQTVAVVLPPFKYDWSAPVAFNGLNADQILTNVPGVIVGAATFGGAAQTVTLTDGEVINFTSDGSVATATGEGTGTGAYPAATTNTTGNADFDAALNEFVWDGGPKTISIANLTVGQYYSVQLFGLDNRTDSGEINRLANYQDPDYVLDVSATFHMGDDVYVVGTFWASNTVTKIQMNLPTGNSGNINALVVRQVPTVALQKVGASLQLTWPAGTLLQAPALTGPWTTNVNTSPYTFLPTGARMFYRVQLP